MLSDVTSITEDPDVMLVTWPMPGVEEIHTSNKIEMATITLLATMAAAVVVTKEDKGHQAGMVVMVEEEMTETKEEAEMHTAATRMVTTTGNHQATGDLRLRHPNLPAHLNRATADTGHMELLRQATELHLRLPVTEDMEEEATRHVHLLQLARTLLRAATEAMATQHQPHLMELLQQRTAHLPHHNRMARTEGHTAAIKHHLRLPLPRTAVLDLEGDTILLLNNKHSQAMDHLMGAATLLLIHLLSHINLLHRIVTSQTYRICSNISKTSIIVIDKHLDTLAN